MTAAPRDADGLDRVLWGADDRSADDAELERTAAMVTAALVAAAPPETPPPGLVARLEADARLWFVGSAPAAPAPAPRQPRLAWWLAAAAAVLAAAAWWPRIGASPAEQRRALLARPGTVVLTLEPGPSALRGDVRGDVAWNGREQRGYLRLSGLPRNDPAERRYQLWIVDGTRSEPEPVDGGLFDVEAPDGEVVVPVREKLDVGDARAFVVTVERPAGVVVSRQEQVVCMARR